MLCRYCSADALRRERRRGLLQRHIFPRFGLYPWECMYCGKVQYYKNKGYGQGQTPPYPANDPEPKGEQANAAPASRPAGVVRADSN
jgi:hypothetical protein